MTTTQARTNLSNEIPGEVAPLPTGVVVVALISTPKGVRVSDYFLLIWIARIKFVPYFFRTRSRRGGDRLYLLGRVFLEYICKKKKKERTRRTRTD